MKCIYCGSPNTYLLADKQRKCARCKHKFSPQKIEREEKLWKHFSQGYNARDTSKLTKMHFTTVQKYYENSDGILPFIQITNTNVTVTE
jgi:hypothetical protein